MDKVIELLARAAERLGFEAARVWPDVVSITWVQAMFWVVVEPIIAVACVGAWLWLLRRYMAVKRRADEVCLYFDSEEYMMGLGFGGFAVVFVLIVFFSTYPGQLTAALYPEATTVLRMIGK